MADIARLWRARPFVSFLAIAGLITLIRVVALFYFEADLGPDEAQYWAWSKSLDFGYYSKPPLIAWTIWATTALFGDQEWAVRFAAPFCHLGAAIFLYLLGRRLYSEAAGFWAGLSWLVIPGVVLSAALMTTDALLLFLWSAALYFFFRVLSARETGANPFSWSLALGAAIGLGLLAKYAMIYFVIGMGLALVIAPDVRKHFRLRDAAVALAVAGFFIAPNIAWNAEHDFHTLSHTARNADWERTRFQVLELLEFLAAQFGVFGPVPMAFFLWGLATLAKRLSAAGAARAHDLALIAFALPPLVIVSAQAFIARAHANWAATAFPSAIVLVIVWALRDRLQWGIKWTVGAHVAAAALFLVEFSNFALIDTVGLASAINPVRSWSVQGEAVRRAAAGYDAILVDNRRLMASLLYYARGGPPIVSWNSNRRIDNHFEAFMAYDPAKAPRVLFVTPIPEPLGVAYDFGSVEAAGRSTVDLKDGPRTFYFFALEGFGEEPL
ncbi:MAG: glycosyltransferase family 39 protein [Parvularculaceae bacterium]